MLNRINLLTSLTTTGVTTGTESPSRPLIIVCVIAVIGCLILSGALVGYYRLIEQNILNTERQIKELSRVEAKMRQRDRLTREISAIKTHLDKAEKRQNRITKVLDELAEIIPQSIQMKIIKFEYYPNAENADVINRKITLQGKGPDHLNVSQFVYQLQNSSLAEGCTIEFAPKSSPLVSEEAEFGVTILSETLIGGNV